LDVNQFQLIRRQWYTRLIGTLEDYGRLQRLNCNIFAQTLNICLNINIIMTFKTLTIKESVYKKLLLVKKKDESFSDLFERLSNSNIQVLKKMRGCNTYENKEDMLKEIYEKRKEKR
jgi:predicted CopG family antitoxin